ncbi:MAG: aminopeptidase P family protein [Chloroflexi bacterium]|nr:aminopeptidase P family protein [Chloroflexota bacterium]
MPQPVFPRFSEAEYQRRHANVRAMLARERLDALIIHGDSSLNRFGQADIHYVSNFLGNRDNLVVFPPAHPPTLFMQSRNHAPDARRASILPDTRWGGRDSAETVLAHLREIGLTRGTLGVVGNLPYGAYVALAQALPDMKFRNATAAFRMLRVDKSDEEIAWIRRGAAYTDAMMVALEAQVRPGMREDQLSAIVEGAYIHDGGQHHLHYISSTSMYASDRCVPAQNLSERVVQKGDVILTELSAAYWGYSGQILRPIAVGAEPTGDYADLYRVAEEAYWRVCAAIKPGVTALDAQQAGAYIDGTPYTILDGLVHGFCAGLLPPSIDTPATQEEPLKPFVFRKNQCLVVQPNIVTKDLQKGVQLGNLCLVTDSGLETLQKYPNMFVRAG